MDLFGSRSLAADAEIIKIAYDLMRAFGARDEDFRIGVSNRAYLNALVVRLGLSLAQGRELLILLDRRAKIPEAQFLKELSVLGLTPSQVLGDKAPEDVVVVLALLVQLGVPNARFDTSVVRGFDYYTGVIFEITDTHPNNKRSLFGGGRYDNLTALFDREPLPGVGFGMGDVSLRDFLEVRGLIPPYTPPTKVYLAVAAPEVVTPALQIAGELRAQGVSVAVDFGEKKLSEQIKTAAKHKIPWLIVVGPDELTSGNFGVKNLNSGVEERLARAQLAKFFLNL